VTEARKWQSRNENEANNENESRWHDKEMDEENIRSHDRRLVLKDR